MGALKCRLRELEKRSTSDLKTDFGVDGCIRELATWSAVARERQRARHRFRMVPWAENPSIHNGSTFLDRPSCRETTAIPPLPPAEPTPSEGRIALAVALLLPHSIGAARKHAIQSPKSVLRFNFRRPTSLDVESGTLNVFSSPPLRCSQPHSISRRRSSRAYVSSRSWHSVL